MLKKLMPRQEDFFDMFDEMCDNILQGAVLFKKMVTDTGAMTVHAEGINSIEHKNDELGHEILSKLHKTFITPIDREDIHTLTNRLDDILDLTYVAAMNIIHYKPKKLPPELSALAEVLIQSVTAVKEMMSLFRDLQKNQDRILQLRIEINRLENEADSIRRGAMARLFQKEKNAVELMKIKDILNFIENATDMCEDVSDIVEGVVLENN